MKAAIRRRATAALFILAMSLGLMLTLAATPASANRAWVLTETIFLDRPGHDGRMLGQYQTCDEVWMRDTWRGWVLVEGRRGSGWVHSGVLARYQPGACRYEYRPPHPIRPPYPVLPPIRPPYPDRPPRPIRPPQPEPPIWPREPEIRPPYWGP